MIGKRITGAGILILGGGSCLYVVVAIVTSLIAVALNRPIPIEPLVWLMLLAMAGLPIGFVGWVVEQFEKPRAPTIVRRKETRR
jgi:hypothetical protein